MLLLPLTLGGRDLTSKVTLVLEFCFDAGEIEVTAILRDVEWKAISHQRREPGFRLFQCACGRNAVARAYLHKRLPDDVTVTLKALSSRFESIPPLVVYQPNLATDRGKPQIGIVGSKQQPMLGA